MSEQDQNKKIQEAIEASGGYVIKTIITNKSGTNDMLACINGRFCSIEGKVKGRELEQLQVAHQIKVIKAGGLAIKAETVKDVLLIIKQAKEGYIQPLPESGLKKFTL